MRGLDPAVLDRRLAREAPAPLAIAFSGGGDSLALLLIAADWARAQGRTLLALTVDHRLQAKSAEWTQTCAATASRLGAQFQALAWEGEKPAAGLSAAARAARHRLLAEAARAAGARVVLMGHTADDILEAAAMRAAGATTPDPREWAPSPVWPEGRGVFLLRPLLGVRRAEIRAWLAARGESWIDDPANDDPAFARARARMNLGAVAEPAPSPAPIPGLAQLARGVSEDLAGGLSVGRADLAKASWDGARALVAAACLCAAGTRQPPRGARLDRLTAALRKAGPLTATLAGARIEADAEAVRFWREAGEARRGGLAPLDLAPGVATVWDGRFEITTAQGAHVRPLRGLAARLAKPERARLADLPAAARGGLPALVDPAGAAACPALGPTAGVELRRLAHERLQAACGAVEREPR